MALDLSKFLARFVEEAGEHISRLNEGILSLEKDPTDSEALNSVFRSAHTLKGSSRIMKLTAITEVAHKLEDVLDALRSGKIVLTEELPDLLFAGIDAITDMVEKAACGEPVPSGTEKLLSDLDKAAGNGDGNKITSAEEGGNAVDLSDESETIGRGEGERGRWGEVAASSTGAFCKGGMILSSPSPRVSPSPRLKLKSTALGEGECPASHDRLEGVFVCRETRDGVQSENETPAPGSLAEIPIDSGASETVRVRSQRLDELIRLTGEVLSAQSRLKRRLADLKELEHRAAKALVGFPGAAQEQVFPVSMDTVESMRSVHLGLRRLGLEAMELVSRQDFLSRELQGSALRMRMLPLSTVFDPMHRLVRDIARDQGKKVQLIVEGGETELDRKMIEQIGAPLVHMIRNAVDHAMETPEDRAKAGKPETGIIRLSACYEGERALIAVSDDGKGIPIQAVKEKALKKGLYTKEDLERLPGAEIVNLIFRPGFSTAQIITDVSGRGVGMDVVRKNIVDSLNGSIEIETKEGVGTTFTIRLLLTLAVMRVLRVNAEGMTFAIPSNMVSEILNGRTTDTIDIVGRKAIRVRSELVPLARLGDVLNLPERKSGHETNGVILIMSVGAGSTGLAVDAVIEDEDMVIRPLPAHLQDNRFVSGAAVCGDGELINVLNAQEILDAARETRAVRSIVAPAAGLSPQDLRILVVDDSVNTREIEKSILEAYGYKVTLAGDGLEAIQKTRDSQYDIVVTDVEMPRMDGFTLTETLRREEKYRDVPIILVTSRDKDEDKRRGIQVGANAYIVKGEFDQSSLLETIRNLVG